ncbi:MAG: 50S ribosomal protein L32 [Bacteroidales bacterium]|nr:50S ribosomal protein L32 [Bacteroidales bacterium]
MPNPKRKHSKQRRDKRRTHYKAKYPTLGKCSNCGAVIELHHICPECGFYRGKKILEKEINV